MADVLRTSVELPTIVFTAVLAIAALLWLLDLLGVVDTQIEAADGALEPFELTDVPATILLTLFGLAGWFVSVLASVVLLDSRSGTALVVWSLAVGLASTIAALLTVMWLGPRLARVFSTGTIPSQRDLLGRIAEVRSATVTDTSGRGAATWPDGTVSTVDIRTTSGSSLAPGELRRGDLALLVDWNEATDDFIVDRVPAELAE